MLSPGSSEGQAWRGLTQHRLPWGRDLNLPPRGIAVTHIKFPNAVHPNIRLEIANLRPYLLIVQRDTCAAVNEKELIMTDHRAIQMQIAQARLANFAFVGHLIGEGVYAVYAGGTRLLDAGLAKLKARIESRDEPHSLPPAYF